MPMSEHKLAILVTAVGAAKASKDLKGVDASLSRIGASAGKGARSLAGNLAKISAVAGVGLAVAIKGGISSLATLETAVTSVDGAIRQMGLTGKVTGAQVAAWANEIEASVGAAFDDKDITAATATLIRFGKVTTGNLRPAMQVITDLAVKTGDVNSAATLLAKALADPTKAAGKLARSGVVLTKAEQDQIKAFVKAGKTAQAQKIILDALTRTTKGAAAASQGPYKKAMSTLADVTEDAQRALAEGFLPVLERIAAWLSKSLADPKVMSDIRGLGRTMASAFDSAVSFVQKLDWGAIKTTMGMVGTGAKMALDAFLAMPSWVQAAVVGGWGLNKLTGGAVGDIAGELGKGLIKGVLGMNAGVVNIRAGAVTGAGGGVTAAGKAGGGLASAVAKVFLVGAAVGVAAELWGVREQQSTANKGIIAGTTTGVKSSAAAMTAPELRRALDALNSYSTQLLGEFSVKGFAFQANIDGVRTAVDEQKAILQRQLDAINAGATATSRDMDKLGNRVTTQAGRDTDKLNRGVGVQSAATKAAVRAVLENKAATQRTTAGVAAVRAAAASGLARTASAAAMSAAAIRAKKMSVSVSVPVKLTTVVTVRGVSTAQITFGRYAGKSIPTG
jgi:hypothetical protein